MSPANYTDSKERHQEEFQKRDSHEHCTPKGVPHLTHPENYKHVTPSE